MPEISIKAETIFNIGSLAVTNSMFMGFIAAVLIVVVALIIHNGMKPVPGKLQSIFELFIEQALTLMDSILGSRVASLRYLPIVGSIFLFILASNWLGLLPLSHILVGHAPLFRAATADLNFTIALAIISVLAVNILGAAAIGLGKHAGKFFHNPFKDPIMAFVGILELISEFVKIISFSFRLFGNVFAGEVLLTIVAFLVPYAVPLPFLFLEVFVGLIQALIFSMLTLVFLGMSTKLEVNH
ncbi:MAG TPA: F0F1 ATP synthase subunit A [Candidatus Paceibacterota bacterium]